MRFLLFDSVPLTYGGGYEAFLIALTREAVRRGHHIDIAVGPRWMAHLVGLPLGLRLMERISTEELLDTLPDVSIISEERGRLRQAFSGADIIYTKNEPHELAYLGWMSPKTRHIVGLHSTMIGRPGLRGRIRGLPYRSKAYGRMLRRASLIHALQEYQRTFVVRQLNVPEEKVAVIANGVDITRYGSPTTNLPEAFTVAFVGRLDHGKGADIAIETARLLSESGAPIQMCVAGDGPLRKRVEKAAVALPNIHYMGHVRDPATVYSSAHVLLVPSRFESAPLVPAEGLASGLPLVVSDIPVLSPFYSKTHALLMRPADPRDAAARLLDWYDLWQRDRSRFERARTSARTTASERFDERLSTKMLVDLMEASC